MERRISDGSEAQVRKRCGEEVVSLAKVGTTTKAPPH